MISERFDVAIQLAAPSESALVVRRIGEIRRHLCAAPAYLAARGEPETLDDLQRHDCLLYSETAAPDVWRLSRGGVDTAVKVRGWARSNSSEARMDLMFRGHGIGPPTFASMGALQAGALRTVLPAWSGRAMPICREGRCTTPACDDGVRNGHETDVDCGGGECAPCGPGKPCDGSPPSCASRRCGLGGRCE